MMKRYQSNLAIPSDLDVADYSSDPALPTFFPPYKPKSRASVPRNIKFRDYCQHLSDFIKETRGKDLQSLVSSKTIRAIFRQQSLFWEDIARQHVESCYAATFEFLSAAVLFVAGRHAGEKVMRKFLNEPLERKQDALESKIKELLWPYQKSHPMMYNPEYLSRLSAPSFSASSDASSRRDEELFSERYAKAAEFDLQLPCDLVSAAEAMDKAEVYYEVSTWSAFPLVPSLTDAQSALNTFVDNVATLAVEAVLIGDLPSLIPQASKIWQMSSQIVAEVVAEPPEAREQRARLAAQIEALKSVIRTCKKYTGPRHCMQMKLGKCYMNTLS